MDSTKFSLNHYFGIIAQPQTYLNLGYLLLTFPMGIFYFTFLVTGFSLGIGLSILWIGLFILAGVIAAIYALISLERLLAINMLQVHIPPLEFQTTGNRLIDKARAFLTHPVAWKGLLYLLLKFPVGIFNFTIVITLIAICLGFILAPVAFPYIHINLGFWQVSSLAGAGILCLIGIFITPGALIALNYLAKVEGWLAREMLSTHPHIYNPTAISPH